MTWTVPGLEGYRNQTPTHREFTGWWKDGLWAGHWLQCEGRLDHCAWLLPQASLELSRERGVGISQGSKKKVTRNFWCLPRICTHVQLMWQPWNRSEEKSLSRVWLFATPWTVTCQAPLSMGFSKQEYWSGLSFPSPGDLPNPGIEPRSPTL